MKIGIVGLGFVGLSYALVLASKGYTVVGVDVDSEKIRKLRSKIPPFHEEGLRDLLKETIDRTFSVTTNYRRLLDSNIIFVAVNAPTKHDGTQDLTQLNAAIKELAYVIRETKIRPIVVIKTTILPGTTRRIAKIFGQLSGRNVPEEVGFAFVPEFLREGKAIHDILYPSRIIIGALDEKTALFLQRFFREFYSKIGSNPPIIIMQPEEAELVKYASNAFLALRISYANIIADICEKIPGCCIDNVLEAVGLDPRIGKSYFKSGLGYGGSCLPKDLRALINYASNCGVDISLFKSIQHINDERVIKVVKLLERELGELKNKKIMILGTAFKSGTDDIRDSQSIKLIRELLNKGADIAVHDPLALENTKKLLGNKVKYITSINKAFEQADAIVIATDWENYKDLAKQLKLIGPSTNIVIIDAWRVLHSKDVSELQAVGLKIFQLGRNLRRF